jgi:hypothetical protein
MLQEEEKQKKNIEESSKRREERKKKGRVETYLLFENQHSEELDFEKEPKIAMVENFENLVQSIPRLPM